MNIFLAARVAEEAGGFSLVEVANGISQKLVRRHPHVFGGEKIDKVPGVLSRWSALKAQEKAPANAPEGIAAPASESVLDGIPRSLPALEAAFELGRRAAKIGFDWPNAAAAIKKVYEEAAEIESCLAAPAPSRARLQYEIGDLLFAVVNVARKLGIAPEPALRQTMQKFRQRFHPVEERVRKSPPGAAPTLEEMERLWQQAKTSE
ncbi:MAG: MazG family protein [Planctomycetes bacterium]|nr:MazG family protein [Planctomycetota bacterium]